MTSKADAVFATVTEKLIDALEGAGPWQKPWQTILGATDLPTNAATGKRYQGINSVYFWVVAAEREYPESRWATYKQWQILGAQVAKGEKATQGIKWGVTWTCETEQRKTGLNPCGTRGHAVSRSMWASVFNVFNVAQTEGYVPPEVTLDAGPDRYANAEAIIAASGANVTHRVGNVAAYSVGTNDITLPHPGQFATTQGYYSTALHELVHWTGDKTRLARDLANRFGSEAYAAEELVAELGAAMLAAHLGIEAEPHPEHASYLAGWVRALRSDKMALYRAAAAASLAVNYLVELATAGESAAA